MNARALIAQLGLRRHPEGGWFRETFRSRTKAAGGSRCCATSIHYLLESDNRSHFHRLTSDELWFFHAGGPLDVIFLRKGVRPEMRRVRLGVARGAAFQVLVPAGTWFAARPARGAEFSLVSCVVAPGFDFRDFELAGRRRLTGLFPRHRRLIRTFTREEKA